MEDIFLLTANCLLNHKLLRIWENFLALVLILIFFFFFACRGSAFKFLSAGCEGGEGL